MMFRMSKFHHDFKLLSQFPEESIKYLMCVVSV
jgi:hypothetical protein